MNTGVVLTAAHCVRGLGVLVIYIYIYLFYIHFYILYLYVRGLGIDIVAIYMYCVKGPGIVAVYICPIITTTFIVFSASVSRLLNLSEAEQLVVRCGEWNTQHENEPLAHQVLQLYSLIREDLTKEKSISFGHCPNYLSPPSPPPNSDKL